jgi:hypothetical protein
MDQATPDSDNAMIRYLLDSISWLDSFDEWLPAPMERH